MRTLVCALIGLITLGPAMAATPHEALPAYTQAYEPTTPDERGVWLEADEDERQLRDSPLLIRNEALTGYVKGVLCDVVGTDRCRSVRVYVIESPTFNASMMANGTMRVHTGLLLRVRNEAELAAVLGHEFGHFELRHTLSKLRQRRNAASAAAWVGVIGGLTNTNTRDVRQSLYLSIPRFSREEETAADLQSSRYLARSPYPALAASQVWQNFLAEDDARAVARGLKPRRKWQAEYLDSHPPEALRAKYLADAASRFGAGGSQLRAEAFAGALAPLLPQLLDAQVRTGDFGGTSYILEQHAASSGWTGELLFARAELYRQRGAPRDLETAAQFLREALAKGYANPLAHRELGLALLRNGDRTTGHAELETYLTQAPGANDRSVIEAMLKE